MTKTDIARILNTCKTIAVVGLSKNQFRPSHGVAKYMQRHGYTIIPVNPAMDEILGETCYPKLTDIPQTVEIVDVFRRSEHVPGIVEQAIEIKAKVLWLQLGVYHEEAIKTALEHGLQVVAERCIKIEHMHLD